jgi:hypothetical protein
MKRLLRKYTLSLILAALMSTSVFPAVNNVRAETVSPAITNNNVKVQLLGMNDLHGKIDITGTVTTRPGVKFGRAEYWAAYLRFELPSIKLQITSKEAPQSF